jgi:hypothetical protein
MIGIFVNAVFVVKSLAQNLGQSGCVGLAVRRATGCKCTMILPWPADN